MKNKTVIFASNDVKYMNYFNKVIFIEKEKVKFIGTNEEIQKEDFFESFKKNLYSQNDNQKNKIPKESESEDLSFGMSNKSNIENDDKNQKDIEDNEISESDKLLNNTGDEKSILHKLVEIENEKIKIKGKLMVEEKINSGRIDSKVYKAIIEYSGGCFRMILVFLFSIILQFTII